MPTQRIVHFLEDFPFLSSLCAFASLREIFLWLRLCRAKPLREIFPSLCRLVPQCEMNFTALREILLAVTRYCALMGVPDLFSQCAWRDDFYRITPGPKPAFELRVDRYL